MGLVSAVKGAVTKAATAVKTFAESKPLAFLNKVESNLQANPVKAAAVATGVIAAPALISSVSTASKAAAPVVAKAATAAAPVVAKAAVSTAKSVVTNPAGALKTTIGGGAVILGGSILASSSKARESVVKAPGEIAQFGTNIGIAIDNPSVENIGNIAKDSPILTGLALAGAALVVSKAAGTIATAANTKAIKDSNDILKNPNTIQTPVSGVISGTSKPLDTPTTLQGNNPSAVSINQPKKQGTTSKRRRRKAKIYKCEHKRRLVTHGHATKCYNFY